MSSPGLSHEIQSHNESLAALIAGIAGGDHDALTTLYDQTHRQLYGLLLRVLNDAATAEEVLLDVYTQVWRQAGRYTAERGTPLAWLVTIARSRAIDRLRAGRRSDHHRDAFEGTAERQVVAPAASVEESVAVAELRRVIQGALAALPTEQREVIELAYYSGLSHTEMALELNQPLGTIKTRVRRAMIRLRDIIGPAFGEGR